MRQHPYILVASGASLWGLIGIFVKALSSAGFTSMEITSIRAFTTAVILFAYIAVKDRPMLSIKPGDIKYFIGTGILSMAFFNWCYFTAINELSLSIAVVLLYTAPAFVIVISCFAFNEKITGIRLTALVLTTAGTILSAGFLSGIKTGLSMYGILAGIGSGFGYSLYTIFAKLAGRKYSPLTITAYTFLTASLFLIFLCNPAGKIIHLFRPDIFLYVIGLGLVPTALAYILYTTGLKSIESGKAAIIANIEPAVAVLTGTTLFGDIFTLPQAAGTLLILSSVFIVQREKNDI